MSASDDTHHSDFVSYLSSLGPQDVGEAGGWLLELAAVAATARAAGLSPALSTTVTGFAAWRRAGARMDLRAAERREDVVDHMISGVMSAGTGVGVGILSAFFTSWGYTNVGAALLPFAVSLAGSWNEAVTAYYMLEADQRAGVRVNIDNANAWMARDAAGAKQD